MILHRDLPRRRGGRPALVAAAASPGADGSMRLWPWITGGAVLLGPGSRWPGGSRANV